MLKRRNTSKAIASLKLLLILIFSAGTVACSEVEYRALYCGELDNFVYVLNDNRVARSHTMTITQDALVEPFALGIEGDNLVAKGGLEFVAPVASLELNSIDGGFVYERPREIGIGKSKKENSASFQRQGFDRIVFGADGEIVELHEVSREGYVSKYRLCSGEYRPLQSL